MTSTIGGWRSIQLSYGRISVAYAVLIRPQCGSICFRGCRSPPLNGSPMQVLLAYLWSEHMESLPFELPLFLLATFAGAVVAGLSGFAFGLVAASLWL